MHYELQALQQAVNITPTPLAPLAGVVLDPVYSGKALYSFLEETRLNPGEWSGKRVMFLHTGGLLGMFDKLDQLQPVLERENPVERMQVKG